MILILWFKNVFGLCSSVLAFVAVLSLSFTVRLIWLAFLVLVLLLNILLVLLRIMFILAMFWLLVLFLMVQNLPIMFCKVLTSLLLLLSCLVWLFSVNLVILTLLKIFMDFIKNLRFYRLRWLIMAKSRRPRAGKSSRKTPRRYYVGGAQF